MTNNKVGSRTTRTEIPTPLGPVTVERAQASDADAVLAILTGAGEWLAARGIDQWGPGRFSRERGLEAADRLKPFPGRRRAATLYVTGEPCLMCLGAAMSFFCGEIVYGHEIPSDGAVSLVQGWRRHEQGFPNYRVPRITGGVLRQEGIDLFRNYVARHSSGAMWEWARTVAAL